MSKFQYKFLMLTFVILFFLLGLKAGATSDQVKVLVVDGELPYGAYKKNGGVSCGIAPITEPPHPNNETVRHALNIALTISQDNDGVCVDVMPLYTTSSNADKGGWEYDGDLYHAALKAGLKYDIVHLSLAGDREASIEKRLIKDLIKSGVIVVVSSGNCEENVETCKKVQWPANYIREDVFKNSNRFVVVRAKSVSNNLEYEDVAFTEKACSHPRGMAKGMCGSSQAAAWYTRKLIP